MEPLLKQPPRLRISGGAHAKFVTTGVLSLLVIVFAATVLVSMADRFLDEPVAGLFGAMAVVAIACAVPTLVLYEWIYVRALRVEAGAVAPLWVSRGEAIAGAGIAGATALVGSQSAVAARKGVPVGPGLDVHVDLRPDFWSIQWGTASALRWTVTGSGRKASFRTVFEPDDQLLTELKAALEELGARVTFSVKPLTGRHWLMDFGR